MKLPAPALAEAPPPSAPTRSRLPYRRSAAASVPAEELVERGCPKCRGPERAARRAVATPSRPALPRPSSRRCSRARAKAPAALADAITCGVCAWATTTSRFSLRRLRPRVPHALPGPAGRRRARRRLVLRRPHLGAGGGHRALDVDGAGKTTRQRNGDGMDEPEVEVEVHGGGGDGGGDRAAQSAASARRRRRNCGAAHVRRRERRRRRRSTAGRRARRRGAAARRRRRPRAPPRGRRATARWTRTSSRRRPTRAASARASRSPATSASRSARKRTASEAPPAAAAAAVAPAPKRKKPAAKLLAPASPPAPHRRRRRLRSGRRRHGCRIRTRRPRAAAPAAASVVGIR